VSNVTLIRHGQANSGARSEAEYDALSDLGRRQAQLTGTYLAATRHGITRIISGSLNRQRDTAQAIGRELGMRPDTDPRLNEIDYFSLEASLREHIPDTPANREEFLLHFPQVMSAWQDGVISCPDETFDEFEARVGAVLSEAEAIEGTLLVTSGGIIGMMLRHVLDLSVDAFSHALLQAHNTSIHRYQIEAGGRRLVTFNATPQFDPPDLVHARTFI
jgi:broad specificity phosphatase PhoE